MSAAPLDGAAVFDRAPAMAWQTVDGEMVLLNVDGQQLMGLNGVGARVWELVDGERSIGQIAATVALEFEVEPAQAEVDVTQFVGELVALGALERR